jgi:hypothetical protein
MIAKGARRQGSNSAGKPRPKKQNSSGGKHTTTQCGKHTTNPGFHSGETHTTGHGGETHTTLDTFGVVVGDAAASLSEAKPGPKPAPMPKPKAPASVAPPVAVVNGNGAKPPSAVMANAASIAEAEAVLARLIAERDRLHRARNLMPAEDERLRQLLNEVSTLQMQIRTAKLMS